MDFTSRQCRKRAEDFARCPSSSLGVNCLQFGFCVPTIPAIDFPLSINPDWMTSLVQSRPEITLKDMVIPGSHDSGSYSIENFKVFSAVGRTQTVNVLDQLHRGSRYLDIRLGESVNGINVFHGCLQGTQFERVLEEISTFCNDFPGEFVIIEVVAEYGRTYSSSQKIKTLELVKDVLGDKMYGEDNKNKLMSTPLKELVLKGKQVCVLLHSRFYDGLDSTDAKIAADYNCFPSGKWMDNKWHNTRSDDQLFEWNLEEVQVRDPGKFLCNQFVLTPGVGGSPDILKLMMGAASLQPVYLSSNMYNPPKKHGSPPLHTFFQRSGDEKWNIVSLDFVDLCPAMVGMLVGLNFGELEIILATVQYGDPDYFRPSMAVTSKVQSHMTRNRVLFLNVGKDFGSNFGTLTLAYRSKGKYYCIVIHFDGTSVIVLHEYNHLQAGSKEIVIDADVEEGSVDPGGGGTVMTWYKSEEDDDEIEFDFDSPF